MVACFTSPGLIATVPPVQAPYSRANELTGFVAPYTTVAYSIPPTPPMGMGAPYGPVTNAQFDRRFVTPILLTDRICCNKMLIHHRKEGQPP